MIQRGWQDSNETDLMPYQRWKNKLSVHDGCVLWGCRVIVPPAGHEKITQELHEGHPGVTHKGTCQKFCVVASPDIRAFSCCTMLLLLGLALFYTLGVFV